MIVTRKNLAREALDRALEVREEADIAFNVQLCVYGLCDRLDVRVQFVDINMEGLYLRSRRPLSRRVFTCGHELGHHVFDPVRDHTGSAQLPFSCLQHISFVPDKWNGTLSLNAFYATQQLFTK